MLRFKARVALTCSALSALAIVACAQGGPADDEPSVNPNLPGVDAAGNSLPTNPGDSSTSFPGDDSSVSDTESDAGSDAAITDTGTPVVDSSPPPTTAPKPAVGEIVISEIMYNPSGTEPLAEWIELHSLASSDRTLTGLTLKDGDARTAVLGTLTIAAGAYIVLVRDKTTALAQKLPAAAIVYEYGTGLGVTAGIILSNGSTGGISLLDGATTLVSVPYGGWFTASNASIQLSVLTAAASSTKASWCTSTNAWTSGSDDGTPGAADDCP